MRALWCTLFVFFGGCTCGPRVMGVEPEAVRVMPSALTFDDTFVGASSLGTVTVINPSRVTRQLSVSVELPFTLVSPIDSFPTGDTELQLVFTPTAVGLATGTLRVGELEVSLNGVGLKPLACGAENPCEDSRFDAMSGRCVSTNHADGEACQTRCVTGTCAAGTCAGTAVDCPQTTCTVGVCSEVDGCGQVARECPAPSNPCQHARCDETLGCATEEAEDGTVCGVDDCRLPTVEVCIVGQCVVRPRVASGQCAHTWLPLTIGSRFETALGHDAVGHRVITFGGGGAYGKSDDTWAWDGTRWTLLTPPNAPSARNNTPLVSEGLRRVALLFGGQSFNGILRDTWEWDGRTWLQRTPMTSPPARWGHALTWDAGRQRAVLFGGVGTAGRLADTWEWDGRQWSQRSPAQSPSPRLRPGFAYDPVRRVTVLYGGGGTGPGGEFELTDTWEFDGTTWTQRASPMLAMTGLSRTMAWDPVTRSVLLVSTRGNAVEVWRYDGSWHAVTTPSPSRGFGGVLTLDADRRRLVFVSGPGTWEWDGVSFTLRQFTSAPEAALPLITDLSPSAPLLIDRRSVPWHWLDGGWSEGAPFASSPAPRPQSVGDWDPVRQRFVLFGGYGTGPQLWELAADGWSTPTETGTAPPVGCERAAGAYDVSRSAFVVAGCEVSNDDGGRSSFEWNGATWTEHPGPPRTLRAMAWDPAHQHLVAVGNGVTFTRSGGQWTQQPDAGLTLSFNYGLVVDAARSAVVLVGEPTNGNPVTWEWTGSAWSRPALARQPPASTWMHGNTLVYEPAEQRVLLYDNAALWQYVP